MKPTPQHLRAIGTGLAETPGRAIVAMVAADGTEQQYIIGPGQAADMIARMAHVLQALQQDPASETAPALTIPMALPADSISIGKGRDATELVMQIHSGPAAFAYHLQASAWMAALNQAVNLLEGYEPGPLQ